MTRETAVLAAMLTAVTLQAQELGWTGERPRRRRDAVPAGVGHHPRERHAPRARVDLSHRRNGTRASPRRKPPPSKPTPLVVDGDDVCGHAARPGHRARCRPPAPSAGSSIRASPVTSPTATSPAAACRPGSIRRPPTDAAMSPAHLRCHSAVPTHRARCPRRPCLPGVRPAGHRRPEIGLRIPPFEPAAYSVTSPPVVVNGLVITGSSVADNTRPDLPSGEVRAYDARTGALQVVVGSVPQAPVRIPPIAEWRGPVVHASTGAANAWSVLAGRRRARSRVRAHWSAAPDYYGALRLGDNRYANSLVALNASTGALVWAFQTVHHDLVGLRHRLAAGARDAHARRQRVPADRASDQDRHAVRAEPRDRRADLPGRGTAGSGQRCPARGGGADAAVHRRDAAAQPASLHARMKCGESREADREACRAVIAACATKGSSRRRACRARWCCPRTSAARTGAASPSTRRQIAVVPVNRIAAMVQLLPREGFDLARTRRRAAAR